MPKTKASWLKGKILLAVDDEPDVLETIEDILDEATIDKSYDFESASVKIAGKAYDLAILDIMGVNGLELLDLTVERNIPTVMLTAHAVSPDVLLAAKRKGALSFLPKEEMANLDELLEELVALQSEKETAWNHLFGKLGGFFDRRFGKGWNKEA